MAYSSNIVMTPTLNPDTAQTLASYQSGPCSAKNPISRYFKTNTALNRLGIEWFPCKEFPTFSLTGDKAEPLYTGQLAVNSGSSTIITVNRAKVLAEG